MERMNYLWARNTGGLDGTQQCSLAFCFWLGKSTLPDSGHLPQSALLVYDEDMLQFLHIYRWNDLVPQEGRLLECPLFLLLHHSLTQERLTLPRTQLWLLRRTFCWEVLRICNYCYYLVSFLFISHVWQDQFTSCFKHTGLNNSDTKP